MDRTETRTGCQRSNSEQLEVNSKLFYVIRRRNISINEKVKKIEKLLGKKPQPDINTQDGNDNRNTALHLAIERNELEVVNFLLSQGADTAIENGDGKTPLQLAEECNHVDIIDTLKGCISQVEWPPSGADSVASYSSQPVAANPNQESVFYGNSNVAATGKQTTSTVRPPFSGKVTVDKELKLSHDDFKQSIEEFYANKQSSAIDQLKETPRYPTPYVLAQFASMAYRDCKPEEPKPPEGWKLLTTASNGSSGYFGTTYWHPEHQQVVIAHRGTETNNIDTFLRDIRADILGVYFNNYVDQMNSASTFANKVVAVLEEIEQEKKVSFELFFTGHSLGGWLAQVTTFTTEYLEVKHTHEVQEGCNQPSWTWRFTAFITEPFKHKAGEFLRKLTRKHNEPAASSAVQDSRDVRDDCQAQTTKFNTEHLEEKGGTFLKKLKREEQEPPASSALQDSHDGNEGYHPHTVVFDSPGCEPMLSEMKSTFDVRLYGRSIDLQNLDITSYLSAPNRINTCNLHLGTVYRIFTNLSDMGWKEKNTVKYSLATHSMDKIVQAFDPATGQVRKDEKGELKIRHVVDWPVSAGLMGEEEWKKFFIWAEPLNNYHPEEMDSVHSKVPKGYHLLRYQTKAYDECTKSLSIFKQDQREFLEQYLWLRHLSDFFKPDDLFSVMNDAEAVEADKKLQNFELGNECVRCPDASTLHALIPYVKRLVLFFPQIKENIKAKLSSTEIRNRVYQHETQCYVKNIDQSALDFKREALGLKEFLTSDRKFWQLQMVDGDAWTGLTKVYRVLQKTSCMPNYNHKGHYTILKLKRLLTVNRMINLKSLLASMKTPHLLMISCGTNQPVNDELTDMFKELFNILEQMKTLKIILTTQPEDSTAASLQQIARIALSEGFITTDGHLSWSDLTASSQTEILKRTVNFKAKVLP